MESLVSTSYHDQVISLIVFLVFAFVLYQKGLLVLVNLSDLSWVLLQSFCWAVLAFWQLLLKVSAVRISLRHGKHSMVFFLGYPVLKIMFSLFCLYVFSFFLFPCTAQNCPRPPKGENMDLKGNDILLTSFPDGTTVTFACNIGYESAGGSPRITCTAGSWSSLGLKCQREY